jgi:SAM-dependent methyltransferase
MLTSRDSIRRRLAELREVAADVYRSREDLQQAFPDPASNEYWIWVNRFGVFEVPAIRRLVVPLPPLELRTLVGGTSEASFLDCGASAYRLLDRLTRAVGTSLAKTSGVLDFGCGCGRVLRYLLNDADRLDAFGCDVDARMIGWNRANFPFGEFAVHRATPPIDVDDARFDLIYAISVFSHLTQENHLAWLAELRRLLRPSGLLIATVHGRHALRASSTDEQKLRLLAVSAAELATAAETLDDRHYAFIRQPESHLDPEFYGITFLDEEYVSRSWSKLFEVVSYAAAALDEWQDAVVLRRRR